MTRFLLLAALLLAGLSRPAYAYADGIPAKPDPFTFVTDQAHLLSAADAQKLSRGLSKYAASTGTPIIVVTVPSLGGANAADMARQIGNTWQVGQTDKNNGIVVLLSSQEHKLSIQAGSGMQSRITPAVVQQVIQEMTPAFKQNNYFAGLRQGLNTLMVTANPSSDPRKNAAAATATAPADAAQPTSDATSPAPTGMQPIDTSAEPVSTGLPWGTILLGVVVVVGGFLLLRRVFGGNSASRQTPDFMGNNATGNNFPNSGAPNQGYQQGNYGAAPSSGPGMGGLLATGAAAAAGAYLGERLGSSHDSNAGSARGFDSNSNSNAGTTNPNAADNYFSGNSAGSNTSGPDYFSDDNSSSSSSGDYFSDDNSSSGSDDTSGDFGGGDFSSSDDNSGSW